MAPIRQSFLIGTGGRADLLPTVASIAGQGPFEAGLVRPPSADHQDQRAAVRIARMLGARVSGSCSVKSMERAKALGIDPVFDYQTTDLSKIEARSDVVYDTAGTMTVATGLALLRHGGVFLDNNPTPAKFIRAIFNRKLKPVVCTARADILDSLADAARAGHLKLPVAETVPLGDAISLIEALESGRRLEGKGLVEMI